MNLALVSIFYSSDVPSDELSLLEKSLFTAMTLNPLQTLLAGPFQTAFRRCPLNRVEGVYKPC